MKALVGAFNQEKALVGAFSVLTNLRVELFQALAVMSSVQRVAPAGGLHAAPGPAAGGGGGLPRAHGPGHPHPHHHLAPHQVSVTHHRVLLTAHSRVRVSVAAVPPVTVSRPTLTFASLTGTDTLQVGVT